MTKSAQLSDNLKEKNPKSSHYNKRSNFLQVLSPFGFSDKQCMF
jgi:hypothetical protein